MKVTLKQLASDVAVLLGESLALECRPEESPFPGMEERVKLMAPGVLADMIKNASAEELNPGNELPSTVSVSADGIVSLPLPGDFLRLVSVKMSDWQRDVTVVTGENDPALAMQWCRWRGIRGQPERPVVIIGRNESGERCLLMFSSSQDARLEYGRYMPYPRFDTTDSLDIPDRLYPLLLNVIRDRGMRDG